MRVGVWDRARTKINQAYSDVFVNRTKEMFALTFDMELELSLHDGSHSRKTWAVHHTMQQSVGPELTGWGRERKLFGWVGVAVPSQVRRASQLMQKYPGWTGFGLIDSPRRHPLGT
jgi:hypothetical protein